MIEYRILGPLEVSANGRLIEVGGPKLRALLVILLLRANESVPRDVLVDELWGEQPPVGAQHSLDVYVSRLRKSLDAAADGPVVMTRPGAYSLQLAEGQLDARRFEQLVGQGRAALAANAPSRAASIRGPCLLTRSASACPRHSSSAKHSFSAAWLGAFAASAARPCPTSCSNLRASS